jgi:hypothetical protein
MQDGPREEDGLRDVLERIEAKLDTLIQALAEEEEDAAPTHDLDGNALPPKRTGDEFL